MLPSMYEFQIHRNLRWACHIRKMDNSRLLKQILHSQLKEGVRGIGRPRLRFKDTVKRNLKDKNIPVGSWQSLSRNRCQWRDMVHKKSSSDAKDSQMTIMITRPNASNRNKIRYTLRESGMVQWLRVETHDRKIGVRFPEPAVISDLVMACRSS